MKKILLSLIFIILFSSNYIYSQGPGDYRTITPVDSVWSSPANWQYYNGSIWLPASSAPSSLTNVYIQAGHVIKLTQDESCKNLYISTGTTDPSIGGDGQVMLTDFALSINGKLSCYYGAVVINPLTNLSITSSSIIPASPITKTANSNSGRIKFTGSTRNITVTGEWGETNIGDPTSFDIEINLNTNNTATIETGIKAYNWIINSELAAGSHRISADNGTVGQADVTINSGGVLKSSQSGISNQVISRDTTSRMGTLTLNGQLWLSGDAPAIDANSIVSGGTVFYNGPSEQDLVSKGRDTTSAQIDIYNNINVMIAGNKSSLPGQNVVVNGAMVFSDFAYFALGVSSTLSYGSSGILNYSSGANVKISDSEFPDVNSPHTVIINDSLGVLLDQSKTIIGSLIFTSGTLELLSGDLTISSAATITGVDSTKYIITNDTTGKLIINNVFGPRLFPVGCTSYNPVTISNFGGVPENYSVTVQNTIDNPTINNNLLVQRQWNISESLPGGSNAVLTFQWRGYQEGNQITDHSNMVVGHFTGVVYQDLTCNPVLGTDPYTVRTTTPVTSFSPFVVGKQSVLPVELASFTSLITGRDAKLIWTTNTETNNSGFDLERKMLKGDWNKVAFVSGNGTSNITHSYNYSDRNLSSGDYNYRLKQIDNNGNIKYFNLSNEVIIGVPEKYEMSQNYPNPFNPATKINYSLPVDSKVTITLFDISGREISEILNTFQTAGYQTLNYNASALSSGVYFYQINAVGTAQTFSKTMKLVLIK